MESLSILVSIFALLMAAPQADNLTFDEFIRPAQEGQ
jgi:hypothetical protein